MKGNVIEISEKIFDGVEDRILYMRVKVVINSSKKSEASCLRYGGIPIECQKFNWESNKWEVLEEYKNKKWNEELKEWEDVI